MLKIVKKGPVAGAIAITRLVEPRWEAILDNKTKEPSTSLVGIEEATRTQEGTGNPMEQMEEASRGLGSIMEGSMGGQTQTVKLH